jgi:hypothetical protein
MHILPEKFSDKTLIVSREKRVFFLLSLIVWVYIWLRGVNVPITIDEMATFLMYVQTKRFIPPDIMWDANNHFLNSFLSLLSYRLFGFSELSLRLPNILIAPVYFFFVYKIANSINHLIPRWAFLLAMIGTQFIIEFFGYTRGYGLSLAFLTGALYFLLSTWQKYRYSFFNLTILFMVLAVLANLTLIPTALMVFILLVLSPSSDSVESNKRRRLLIRTCVIVIGVIVIVLLAIYSFKLQSLGRLYYGSEDGFLTVTVMTLAKMVGYEAGLLFGAFFILAFITIIAGAIRLLFLTRDQGLRRFYDFRLLFPVLLIGNIIASLLLNQLWNVNFQEDRAALYMLPLFFGSLCIVMDAQEGRRKYLWQYATLPLYLIPIIGIFHVSLYSTVYGYNQMVPRQFTKTIISVMNQREIPPTVGGYQTRRQPWAFYNCMEGGLLNPLFASDYPNYYTDYMIINEDEFPGFHNTHEIVSSVDKFPLLLIKRKAELNKLLLIRKTHIETPERLEYEYYNLLEAGVDTLIGKTIYISLEFTVEGSGTPFEGVFVASVFDSTRQTLRYEATDLDQLKPTWTHEEGNFRHAMLIHSLPEKSNTLIIYFWNKRKTGYSLNNGTIEVFCVSEN